MNPTELVLQLTTLSPTCFGKGSGDGLIDTDILMDKYGLPYINAKRAKGLLKEYATEVIEICGNCEVNSTISRVFGQGGNDGGGALIEVRDFRLKDYENIWADLESLRQAEQAKFRMHVHSHFTTIINQTAVEEESQTAKEGSLRQLRAIREGVTFESKVISHSEDATALIKLAALQTSAAGISRNRGLGQIRLVVVGWDSTEQMIQSAIDCIGSPVPAEQIKSIGNKAVELSGTKVTLTYKIKLLDNLILTATDANRNTIGTRENIDGRKIWGALAARHLQAHGNDEMFKKIFLSDEVYFSNAFLFANDKHLLPIPKCLQTNSDIAGKVVNVFDDSSEKTKAISGVSSLPLEGDSFIVSNVKTMSSFHHSRDKSRLAGRSTEGAIFYYESLEAGQDFGGTISGDEALMEFVKELINENAIFHIGKSKATEYGRVKFELDNAMAAFPIHNTGSDFVTEFIFYFLSPAQLYNDCLFADPSISSIKKYLVPILGVGEFYVEAVAKFEVNQYYTNIWRGKSELSNCFSAGSSFKVTALNGHQFSNAAIRKWAEEGLGEKLKFGMGKVGLLMNDYARFHETSSTPQSGSTLITELHKDNIVRKIAAGEKIEILEERRKAVTQAYNFHASLNLCNHAVGRLRSLFKDAVNYEQIKIFISEGGEKPIMKFFKHSAWKEKENSFNTKEGFKLGQHYFVTFFDTIRLVNKNVARKNTEIHES